MDEGRQRDAVRRFQLRGEMSMKRREFLCTVAAACAVGGNARAADAEPLRLAHTIPLPGVKGRFDHFACDAGAKRLMVAALGNDTGEVFDVAEFKRLRT